MPTVFISYVFEDRQRIKPIELALLKAGFDTWLDDRQLLPGQVWENVIKEKIRKCNYFLSCWSKRAIHKRGYFHAEFKYAKKIAEQGPPGSVFIIPVRLDDCQLPGEITEKLHVYNCFDNGTSANLARAILLLANSGERNNSENLLIQELNHYKELFCRKGAYEISQLIKTEASRFESSNPVHSLISLFSTLWQIDLRTHYANQRLITQAEYFLPVALNHPLTSGTANVIAAWIAYDFYRYRSLSTSYDYRKILLSLMKNKLPLEQQLLQEIKFSPSFFKLLKPILR